jgi:hypothetical protein
MQCLGGAFLLELAGWHFPFPIQTRNDGSDARCRHKI